MHTTEFQITSAALGRGLQIVSLGGEVDIYTAPRLERELAAAAESGARTVVVDLAGTSFVDSTVVGVLLRGHERFERAGGRLVIVSDDPRILRLFQLSGLDRRLRVERSLLETIGALSNGGAR